MTTLFDMTLALAKVLGNVRSSTTTSAGSTTTAVDSTRTEPDNYWNDGTLWVTSGTRSGNCLKITGWLYSTKTFTHPAISAAIGNGAAYSVLNGDWPKDKLYEFINQAYREHCKVLSSDDSLTSVSEQEAYTLPDGVANVKRVEIALTSRAPYYYVPHLGWYEAGDGYLRFNTGAAPEGGYSMRLWYEDVPDVLIADADAISLYINPERLTWEAALNAWAWRMGLSGTDRPEYADRRAYALAQVGQLRQRYPTKFVARDPRTTL